MRDTSLTSEKVAHLIATAAFDKKAEDIRILHMAPLVNFCEYFVIASGTSDRHARAIAMGIEEELETVGIGARAKQSGKASDWVIFDAGDVVAHVFQKDLRAFYQLEYLWRDATVVPFEPTGK